MGEPQVRVTEAQQIDGTSLLDFLFAIGMLKTRIIFLIMDRRFPGDVRRRLQTALLFFARLETEAQAPSSAVAF